MGTERVEEWRERRGRRKEDREGEGMEGGSLSFAVGRKRKSRRLCLSTCLLQEQLDALPGLVMERLTVRRRPLPNA